MSIIKGLFIGLKNLKVVPFNRMTPELHDELGSNLAKVMMVAKMSNARLTKAQREYIVNQAKQLQEFEDRYITGIKDKSGNVIKSDEGIKNTESAKIFNLQGEKLDSSKPIIGGTQQGKKINQETFRRLAERNAQLIKQRIADKKINEIEEVGKRIDSGVAAIVEKILSMKPTDAMKEANLIIGRKGPYKNLSQEDAKTILQDTEDHIFERNIDIDPEDFAGGGIAGMLGERPGYKRGGPGQLAQRGKRKIKPTDYYTDKIIKDNIGRIENDLFFKYILPDQRDRFFENIKPEDMYTTFDEKDGYSGLMYKGLDNPSDKGVDALGLLKILVIIPWL